MNFPKYVDMLLTSSLYFCRYSKLDDPHEGKTTELDDQNERNGIEYLRSEYGEQWSEISGDATPERNEFLKQLREESVVNCWHINESESAMMWESFSEPKYGIAVSSTIDGLDNAFDTSYEIPIHPVKYIDFTKDEIGRGILYNDQLNTKDISFQHEQEVRAIIPSNLFVNNEPCIYLNSNENGKKIPVNLDSLIEKIYVSPLANDWFLELVKSLSNNYLQGKKIEDANSVMYRTYYFTDKDSL